MAETVRLKLPLLAAAQAQKHVTINEGLAILDLFSGIIGVTSRALTAPAGGEVDGVIHILGGAGTGDWAGYDEGDIAFMLDGGWRRILPTTGMVVSDAASGGNLYRYVAGTWTALAEYSSGSWTPVLAFGGNSTGITYSTQLGKYTKVGKQVHVSCSIVLTSKGSDTGAATITGFPFTSSNDGVTRSASVGFASGFTSVNGAVIGTIPPNNSRFSIYQSVNGAGGAVTSSNFGNSSQLHISGTYEAQ